MSTLEVKELSHPTGQVLKIAAGKTLDLKSQGTTTLPTGSVLQVVSTTNGRTQTGGYFLTTTADTWPSSTFALSITPISTTSKIYVQITVGAYMTVGPAALSIFRGSTNLGGATFGFCQMHNTPSTWRTEHLQYLDSPNTTSQVQYRLHGRIDSGTLYLSGDGDMKNTFTLMEIAG